jgi:hypothetical protein
MYCPACGTMVLSGLNYCKNCGARVSEKKESGGGNQLSEASVNFLIAALLGIPIVGIGLIIGLMSVMKKELGFDNDFIGTVIFLSFVLLLAAEAGFVWLLLSRTRAKTTKDSATKPELKEAAKKELGEAQEQDFVPPAHSITENTTRSFDPVYRDPKAR